MTPTTAASQIVGGTATPIQNPISPSPCAEDPSLGEPLTCDINGASHLRWTGDRLVFWSSGELLYWSEGSTSAKTLLEADSTRRWFQADEDDLYWLVSDTAESPKLYHRSLADNSMSELELELSGLVNRFAVADGMVYYPHSEYGGQLHRLPLDKSAEPERISTHTLNRDHALETYDGDIYWNGEWGVLRYDPESGELTNLAPNWNAGISVFRFHDQHVYWLGQGNNGAHSLVRAEISGGGHETVGELTSNDFAVNDKGAYWVHGNELMVMNVSTGESTPLASAWSSLATIAVDETYVYWMPNHALRRLAVP